MLVQFVSYTEYNNYNETEENGEKIKIYFRGSAESHCHQSSKFKASDPLSLTIFIVILTNNFIILIYITNDLVDLID